MRNLVLRLAVSLAAVASLAVSGCKKESAEGPLAGCRPVSVVCAADADCCSFGCVLGTCRQNPLEGGVCRTSDDCQYPRVCANAKCTSSIQCRGGGSSCLYGGDCCSGQCTGGLCTIDLAPSAVISPPTLANQPFTIPIALSGASSTDPNTGTVGLIYDWSVVSAPAGSIAAPTTPTLSATTFAPDVASTTTPYVIQLKVTKGGLYGTATVTFYAVNTPPQITMPADVLDPAYQSRNVDLPVTATVADPDGGPVTCSWTKTSPTNVVTPIPGSTVCAGASGQAATGSSTYTLNEDEIGSWKLTLTATDGVNTATGDRFVNVQNDAPVPNAGPKRWGNLGLGSVPIAGTASDVNLDVVSGNGNVGDAAFTWYWEVIAAPAGSALALPYHDAAWTTPSISFLPDAEGLYTLRLTADDHHGGTRPSSGTSTVDVQVEPFILGLGEVVDAEYVDGASPERLVVVQTDAGNAYKLTILDPSALTVTSEVTLAARPTALALNFTSPAQTEAIVAETGGMFQRITGIQSTPVVATTVPSTSALPGDLVDVVHAGTYAYGFTAGGTVYKLDPAATAAPYWGEVSCPTCATTPVGTRGTGAMTSGGSIPTVWLVQSGSPGRLGRYDVHSNGNLQNQVTRDDAALQGTAGAWISHDGADIYTTRTNVYDALSATLAQRVTTSLPLVPDHLDTAVSTGLVGAIAQYGTASLVPFSRASVGGDFVSSTPKAYPFLGVNGEQMTNYGRFAFVKSGGGGYYAIVRAQVGGTTANPVYQWGVVNLGP